MKFNKTLPLKGFSLVLVGFFLVLTQNLSALKKNFSRDLIILIHDFQEGDREWSRTLGILIKINPKVQIYSGGRVESGDQERASSILKDTMGEYPEGTTFLLAVHPPSGIPRPMGIQTEGNHFIFSLDNGFLPYLGKKFEFKKIVELTNKKFFLYSRNPYPESNPIFDRLIPGSAHLTRGIPLGDLGVETISLKREVIPASFDGPTGVSGRVEWVNGRGWLETNIQKSSFQFFKINTGELLTLKIGPDWLRFPLLKSPFEGGQGSWFGFLDDRDLLVIGNHLQGHGKGGDFLNLERKISRGDEVFLKVSE